MRMDRVLQDVTLAGARGDLGAPEITSVAYDHRAVEPGALFCCVAGAVHDGHRFAGRAVAAGAAGVLAEHQVDVDVAQAIVAPGAVRPAMALASCRVWGDPSAKLTAVGVTGTNGKTSVTHLVAAALDAGGRPAVVIGTLSGARTTPEAPDLQRLLADAVSGGYRAAALEVSSHALVQSRVLGTRFAAGVFTNLGHEHLDYHGTIEAYFEAKARLFEPERCGVAVVNVDDPWGRRLVQRLAATPVAVATYSLADARDLQVGAGPTRFTWRGRRVVLNVPGAFQVPNALAAATAAAAVGVSEDDVVTGLAAAAPIAGRFQVVAAPPASPVTVVVDFAHTADALTAALTSARAIAGGDRVICVFGCGGDRDRDKRPRMGAAAAGNADVLVLTSDNPRSEDPAAIIAGIRAGIDPDRADVHEQPDRAAAIEMAVALARPGDVVVVAGKGHETTIERFGQVTPFDDRTVAAAAVRRGAGERTASLHARPQPLHPQEQQR